MPFPPVSWWQMAINSDVVCLDACEFYQRRSLRNRYYLVGANGKHLMSIPLHKGRNQQRPTGEVLMDNGSDWRTKHWRTLQTCYGRSPFFEYFADELNPLFQDEKQNTGLFDWCMKGICLIIKLLDLSLNIQECHEPFQNTIENNLLISFEDNNRSKQIYYHQVFEERLGFIPDCSILDLLFCAGKQGFELLK